MTANVVRFEDYRRNVDDKAAAKAADLLGMSYYDICGWAGADFERLRAAAQARDYRPAWIKHQLASRGIQPTAAQAAFLDQMVAAAGQFVSRRQRWILRQLKENPPMSKSTLVKLSIRALAEDTERNAYKSYKQQVKAEAKFGTLGDLLKKSQERK